MQNNRLDYTNFLFGVNHTCAGTNPDSVADVFDTREMNAVSLPFDCFAAPSQDFLYRLNKQNYKKIHCGSLMEPGLSSQITSAAECFRDSFCTQASRNIDMLAQYGVSAAVLNLDMRTVLDSPEHIENAEIIIRKLILALTRKKMFLLIPYRIPFGTQMNAPAARMACFLRNTMSPFVKLSVELHFDEFSPDTSPDDLFGMLGMELKELVFLYNADNGYRMIASILRYWIHYLAQFRFDGPFFIAPQSERCRFLLPEFDAFTKIVSTLYNE